jgi:hypothetical protein
MAETVKKRPWVRHSNTSQRHRAVRRPAWKVPVTAADRRHARPPILGRLTAADPGSRRCRQRQSQLSGGWGCLTLLLCGQ